MLLRSRFDMEHAMHRTALRLFGGLAPSYDSVVEYATLFQDRRWKRWVSERLESVGEGDVLDLGCGTLLLEERIADSNHRFFGVDLTREMVRLGHEKRLPNVILALNGDAEALPFAGGKFRMVVGCYVAKYVDLSKFAAEISRVSKPDARVILYDFARPKGFFAPFLRLYIHGCLRFVGFLLGLARRDSSFTFEKLPRIVETTAWDTEIVQAMEKSGFETVEAVPLTGGAVFGYCGRKRARP